MSEFIGRCGCCGSWLDYSSGARRGICAACENRANSLAAPITHQVDHSFEKILLRRRAAHDDSPGSLLREVVGRLAELPHEKLLKLFPNTCEQWSEKELVCWALNYPQTQFVPGITKTQFHFIMNPETKSGDQFVFKDKTWNVHGVAEEFSAADETSSDELRPKMVARRRDLTRNLGIALSDQYWVSRCTLSDNA